MKKILVCAALTGTLLFAGTASVFASGTAHSSHAVHNKTCIQKTGNVRGHSITQGACYMDDGICDNNYTGASGTGHTDSCTGGHHSEEGHHSQEGHHSGDGHHSYSFRDGAGYGK